MALWIKVIATDKSVVTQLVTPADGKSFNLQELQCMVGGHIEALNLEDGTIMWLNEDGKRTPLPYNPVADFIAAQRSHMAWSDYIVGNVVIATRKESGEDDEGDE